MRRVTVFCGSSIGTRPEYVASAAHLGEVLAERNIELVFGGGRIGLMGVLADTVMAAGGRAIGVIPGALATKEIAHAGVTELITVRTMHERKALMARMADGFITLPGGIGTLDELCEIHSWMTLGIHRKPIGLLDPTGFFQPFLAMLTRASAEGFLRMAYREALLVEKDPEALLTAMETYEPVDVPAWLTWDQE